MTTDERNAQTSQKEIESFINQPPVKYTAYAFPERKEIGTWTGQKLGDAFFAREWRGNMGDVRQSVYITGINGKRYYGVFYKSGSDIVRFKQINQEVA